MQSNIKRIPRAQLLRIPCQNKGIWREAPHDMFTVCSYPIYQSLSQRLEQERWFFLPQTTWSWEGPPTGHKLGTKMAMTKKEKDSEQN